MTIKDPVQFKSICVSLLDMAVESIAANLQSFDKARFDSYQRQILIDLFDNYVANKHSILIAPTGSGKSLIALLYNFCITTAHDSIKREANPGRSIITASSVILASDTFLQKQYVESNDKFTNHLNGFKFSMLKGKSNYTCNQNFQPYTKGVCALRKISPSKADMTMPCADTCEYVQTYLRTIAASCKVLNYHLYLSYATYVGEHAIIGNSEAYVFDECHKIDDILDSFANITININFLTTLKASIDAISLLYNEYYELTTSFYDVMAAKLSKMFIAAIKGGTDKEIHDTCMDFFKEVTGMYNEHFIDLFEQVNTAVKSYKENQQLPMSLEILLSLESWFNRCMFIQNDIASISPDKFVLAYKDDGVKQLTFANISTAERMQRYFFNHIDRPIVFMSATVGNAEYFAKHIGLNDDEYSVVDVGSLFDFSKSPIVAVHPLISTAARNRETALPEIVQRVDDILDAHDSHNGVIHCSNKQIATYIMHNSKHKERLLTYANAQGKQEIINKLNKDTNYVMVAFSMEEGVDLYDDLCRFQIIAKLSWAYIGDLLVSRKMSVYPAWYTMSTLNSTLQTFGRGNRHVNDYCINYVLDTSVSKIAHSMDVTTASRFKDMFANSIDKAFINETFQLSE
jgi:Rad3-related DNA helicase